MAEGTVTRRLAFFDLRDWWLSDPRIAELLNYDPQDPATRPFWPMSQQPESGFPYVRYMTTKVVEFPQWWMHNEGVGLEIYMNNIDDSTELVNLLLDMAGEGATSAARLQRWVHNQGVYNQRPQDFEFHSIEYAGDASLGSPSEEGASHSRTAMFNLRYSPVRGRSIA
jgi:hypothetical protein